MLYGSTIELREKPDIKQPCIFFVFNDGIVAIRPPLGSVTISINEANNVRAMGMVYGLGLKFAKELPNTTAKVFATTMSAIDDQAGKPVQTEAIVMSAITGAELAKNGLLGAKVSIHIKGKSQALVLIGSKKAVKEFGGFLAKLLGDRFTTSLK